MRPDRIGTILMEAHDTDEYRAVCAPERPLAWRNPRVFAHLVAVAKTGRTVVAKAGPQLVADFRLGRMGPDRLSGELRLCFRHNGAQALAMLLKAWRRAENRC